MCNPVPHDIPFWSINTLRPRQNGRQFPDDIFKCIFLMKISALWLRFHWSLFPRVQLTIFQHWFAWPAPSHYLNQWWSRMVAHIWVTRPQCVNSLWRSETICRHRSGARLTQVMACYLTVPVWHIISAYERDSWHVVGDYTVNSLRPRQNGRHFPDDIFKCIFLNENISISITISLKFVPKGPINNIPALVQIMAWRRPGDKSLSKPMIVSLSTHICVTRPQWVKLLPHLPEVNEFKRQHIVWCRRCCHNLYIFCRNKNQDESESATWPTEINHKY